MDTVILLSNILQHNRDYSSVALGMCTAVAKRQTKAVDTLRQLISGPKWKPCKQSGDRYAPEQTNEHACSFTRRN